VQFNLYKIEYFLLRYLQLLTIREMLMGLEEFSSNPIWNIDFKKKSLLNTLSVIGYAEYSYH